VNFFKELGVLQGRNSDRFSGITGGGSGHEPAHSAYVGRGMLAAAVVGDVFASPPAEAILACLKAVTGAAGSLIIVMNYTGRLKIIKWNCTCLPRNAKLLCIKLTGRMGRT
jgi:dihydroxyacetone kinase